MNKKKLQAGLDLIVATGEFNEDYGREVLKLVEITARRRGFYSKFSEFEVEFILKPTIVDYLLMKAKKYDKSKSKAQTFIANVIESAISDGISKVYQDRRGNFTETSVDNMYNIEDKPIPMHSRVELEEIIFGKIT